MYSRFAKWYDQHYYLIKNYDEECERLAYLLGKLDLVPAQLLDVCCSTGEHAKIPRGSMATPLMVSIWSTI